LFPFPSLSIYSPTRQDYHRVWNICIIFP
jgi:hypothetical protein